MSSRDRTSEFTTVIKSLQSGKLKWTSKAPIKQRSEFTQIATKISKNLASTFAKLEKLTFLVRKKSLFEDKSVEINELTHLIKCDIDSLGKTLAQLQHVKQKIDGKQKQNHSNAVVDTLQSKLMLMSTGLKRVLETRTENLKWQKSRKEQFSQEIDEPSRNDFTLDMDNSQKQQKLILEGDSYLFEREKMMRNIESTIVDLGQIFSLLSQTVIEQGETVQRIDSNIEATEINVAEAHDELLKYFHFVSTRNRWSFFAVLILFIVLFCLNL